MLTTLLGLFMRRSFIMHQCFAVIWHGLIKTKE
jgi:hypothetical protein